jgi:hypothetical protein
VRDRQRASACSRWLGRNKHDDSTPTIGSNYSIMGATKSFCLKLDEFHLLAKPTIFAAMRTAVEYI